MMEESHIRKLKGTTGQKPQCPNCGFAGEEMEFGVAIRQGEGIVDVGFRCLVCDAEFGFEYFRDKDEMKNKINPNRANNRKEN